MKQVLLTSVKNQPYQIGLYTIALADDLITQDYVDQALATWIKELLDALAPAELFIDPVLPITITPRLIASEQHCEMGDDIQVIKIKTHCRYAAICVDGRLGNVRCKNEDDQWMEMIRLPGPDPKFIAEHMEIIGDSIEIIQHGTIDPRNVKYDSPESSAGCGWRQAKEMTLAAAGFGFYIQHKDDGTIMNVFSA